MSSPFPGMDPFIEMQEWEDFHTRFNTMLSDALNPIVQPDYFVRVERRVYVEHVGEDIASFRRADVAVVAGAPGLASGLQLTGGVAESVAECTLPMPEQRRETYLVIRERESMEVVTVIELLSPSNKRSGGSGRKEYLTKREEILCSSSHLVELDLLRGGERMPVLEGLPDGDYFANVCRAYRRPKAEVHAWTLPDPLPTIPIPLRRGDDDVPVDLQQVFNTVYDRARYDLSINYKSALVPPVAKDQQHWLEQEVLRDR